MGQNHVSRKAHSAVVTEECILLTCIFIKARMRSEAYGSDAVCLFVTTLCETAFACKLRVRFQQVNNRVFQSFD